MKKYLGMIAVLLFSFLPLSATAGIVITPYDAFSGVPVGTNAYKGGGLGTTESPYKGWINTGTKYNTNTWEVKSGYENYFTDKEMVGLVMVQDDSSYFSGSSFGSITITISAPNGLYMTSQSEPSYRRPIEIWFYPSYGHPNGSYTRLSSSDYNRQLSNENPTETWFASGFPKSTASFQSVWFDVVLVLPGTLDPDTNEVKVTENGKTLYYPLVDADDYSCLVTMAVTYTPKSGSAITQTLTIPFTGYYDSSQNIQGIRDASVSMNVVMESNAYNIDLKNNQGNWIDIGEVSYMADSSVNSVLFFSSSSDPFTQGGEFMMVLDNTASGETTAENSLGFTLKLDKPSSSNYSSDILYDGKAYIDTSRTYSSSSSYDSSSSYYTPKSLANAGMIIPDSVSYTNISSTKYKKVYSSRINLRLNTSSVVMKEGRYTGDIYVHVIIIK